MVSFKRRTKKTCVAAAIISCGVILFISLYCIINADRRNKIHLQSELKSFSKSLQTLTDPKTILYWNKFFDEEHFGFGTGQAPFERAKCKVTNCVIWDSNEGKPSLRHEEFDAVWFHAMDRPRGSLLKKKPKFRLPHQKYIFFLLESPGTNKFNFNTLDNFFNLTISYRRDSDIYLPYGFIDSKIDFNNHLGVMPSTSDVKWLEPNFENISIPRNSSLTTKSKLVAWFVSNCHTPSKRELFAKKLSKHIYVDVYGSCGKFKCSRRKESECYDMLEQDYKFYLSFENSLCQDYVTEKLFSFMQYNIVPIVYGAADYKTIAPPMSYIDVKDYSSPKELANHLLYLHKNPQEYEKYFWWKAHYQVSLRWDHILCSLCNMLNNPSNQTKVYSSIERWWNAPNICHSPKSHFKSST